MASCTNITLERIRAEVDFGGGLVFQTPDIKSFNIRRSRSQLKATFSVDLEVPATTVFPVNSDIIIRAGTLGNMKTRFTGQVKQITASPSFENATRFQVQMSGEDIFGRFEGKTFSRRQRTRGPSSFAAITGVQSDRPQKGTSYEKHIQSGGSHRVSSRDTDLREHSKLVKTDRIGWDPFHTAKAPESTEALTGGNAGGSGALDIKPKALVLSPGISARFQVINTTYETGDSWSVSDVTLGTILDNRDGTAIYTQVGLGENTITFTKAGTGATTTTGRATVTSVMIHDHSNLSQGGPAFGTYSSE